MAIEDWVGAFGDARRDRRCGAVFDAILATGSLVLRRIGGDRAREVAARRFLGAEAVTCEAIVKTLSERTVAACAGRRIVAVQDTTEVNFAGRSRPPVGLGPGGNGTAPGFFLHPLIAVDAEDAAVLGLLDAAIWTREEVAVEDRRQRPLSEKESRRWLDGARAAAASAGAGATETVVVCDREGDIYALFARQPAAVELLVRVAQDRNVDGGGRLFDAAADWPVLGTREITVAARRGGVPARTARVALRAGRGRVKRPSHGLAEGDPEALDLTLVEVRETAPPARTAAVHWRLLTTLAATTLAEAEDIARLYRLRWRIEQVFRALKSDGLGLEDTQLQDAGRLFKLAMLGLAAAVRTLQLVDARDGGERPAGDVAEPEVVAAAAAIGATLEGKTARQKNPHPPGSLPWLAWIIARLGGWNCYYKPPGPKTMRAGWSRFASMATGYHIALTQPQNPENV